MEPTVVFTLLIIITVCASSHPLETHDTTTFSPDDPNKVLLLSIGNISQTTAKSSAENRLEITLKLDESDKEVVDNDMGKYHESSK